MQNKKPLKSLNMYLDGFHFYSGDMTGQMEAHHYCCKPNEDVTQWAGDILPGADGWEKGEQAKKFPR